MADYPPAASWLTDMDGVLVHEEQGLPGDSEFIEELEQSGTPFLVLTADLCPGRDRRRRADDR